MRQGLTIYIVIMLILCPMHVWGAMSSTNYFIYADSVDTGGGLSTSGSYSLQGSTGESPTDFATSSLYEIRAGYEYMERGYLSLDIDVTSLNLGTLSDTAVNSASTTATVGTDSITGYTLSTSAVSGTSIANVTDGTVTAGSEEYGFSGSGSDNQISGDVGVATGVLIASTSTPVTASQTTLTFKAAMSVGTSAGSYSQTITIAASANI